MTNKVYKDAEGNRKTIADLGVTWISNFKLAELGWVEVDADYQTPIPESTILANAKVSKESQIKSLLSETDYKCLKYVDGELTAAEYESIKAYRTALRAAFNKVDASTTVAEVEAIVIPTL